jgi:hypothetical protein
MGDALASEKGPSFRLKAIYQHYQTSHTMPQSSSPEVWHGINYFVPLLHPYFLAPPRSSAVIITVPPPLYSTGLLALAMLPPFPPQKASLPLPTRLYRRRLQPQWSHLSLRHLWSAAKLRAKPLMELTADLHRQLRGTSRLHELLRS